MTKPETQISTCWYHRLIGLFFMLLAGGIIYSGLKFGGFFILIAILIGLCVGIFGYVLAVKGKALYALLESLIWF